MKKLLFFALLILSVSGFWFCQKRLFKDITISGISVDWFNNKPVPMLVTVGAQKANNTSRSYVKIIEFGNGDNAVFSKTFKAARSGEYFIRIEAEETYNRFHFDGLEIPAGNAYDFGTLDLKHKFVCKVIMNYTSGLYNSVTLDNGYMQTGRSGETYTEKLYTKTDFGNKNQNFILSYKISYAGGNADNYTLYIPIGKKDTVVAAINY